MFVRDSCSKQLDSDRLAAYVPEEFWACYHQTMSTNDHWSEQLARQVAERATSSRGKALGLLRASWKLTKTDISGMLTAYIPLARNRDISVRSSLVLLLHRVLDRVLRRVLAREHPHGGGTLLLELACLAHLVGRLVRRLSPGRFQLAHPCLQL